MHRPMARKTPVLPAAALLRPRAWLPIRNRAVALILSPGSNAATPTPASVGSNRSNRVHSGNSAKRDQRNSRRLLRGQVRFASPQWNSTHDITPYEEFYGAHPNQFNFDACGNMVPPSPMGFSPIMPVSPSVQTHTCITVLPENEASPNTATPQHASLSPSPSPPNAATPISLTTGFPRVTIQAVSPSPTGPKRLPFGPSPQGSPEATTPRRLLHAPTPRLAPPRETRSPMDARTPKKNGIVSLFQVPRWQVVASPQRAPVQVTSPASAVEVSIEASEPTGKPCE